MKRSSSLLLALLCAAGLAARPAGAADTKAPAPKTSTHASSGAKPAVVDSLGLMERTVAKDSSNWNNLNRLGLMLLDRDRTGEAVQVFQKASKVKPDHVPTLVNLGAALDADGRARDAQLSYRAALKLSPTDSVATCRLASSLYAVASYAESIDLLRQLITANPKAYCAYFTMGVAFADAGIYKDAIRMWKKVIELAPTSPEGMSAKESIDVLERVLQAKAN